MITQAWEVAACYTIIGLEIVAILSSQRRQNHSLYKFGMMLVCATCLSMR